MENLGMWSACEARKTSVYATLYRRTGESTCVLPWNVYKLWIVTEFILVLFCPGEGVEVTGNSPTHRTEGRHGHRIGSHHPFKGNTVFHSLGGVLE